MVYCAQLPRDCQTIEFIVFEYQDNDIGRGLVTVRCRSCEYCLDPPTRTIAARGIRNYGNRQEVKEMVGILQHNVCLCVRASERV